MDIDQNKLRELILRILKEYQSKGSFETDSAADASPLKAYVYCGEWKQDFFLDFLRENKRAGALDVTAVIPWGDENLKKSLMQEELCSGCEEGHVHPDNSVKLSVYCGFGRTALAESALGMDRSFASCSIRGDFECGRKVVILSGGIDPFTGKEPKPYQNVVLSYIRSLAGMGVLFKKNLDEVKKTAEALYGVSASVTSGSAAPAKAPEKKAAVKEPPKPQPVPSRKPYKLKTENNLLTGADIRKIPYGCTVYLSKKKVLTPMAKDAVLDLNLKLVRE